MSTSTVTPSTITTPRPSEPESLPRIPAYPVPVDLPESRAQWIFDPARAVLLVHDMQRYFLRAFAGPEPTTTVITNINKLRELGMPVVFSAQPGDQDPAERGLLSDVWGPGLKTGEPERIIDELTPREQDIRLTKWRYSAFQRTDLRALLRERGRDQLVITGVYAHLGCLITAYEAFMQDVEAFFVADAVADFSAADHEAALHYAARNCAVVTTTEALLNGSTT